MRVGTKSLLFGVHQFLLHPLSVAVSWWKLYGFPRDPRVWVAFFVHDIGYWGKPNMDGPEGEGHVELGGRIMDFLFGPRWGDFCRRHSRTYAHAHGKPVSRLCVADKFSLCITPGPLYLFLASLSGEISEYMARDMENPKYLESGLDPHSRKSWHNFVKGRLTRWVHAHATEAME